MGQSIVLSEIKAETPLQNDDPSHHQILWQQYMEQIESLSHESKVSRFCMEAGFVHVVEVGQYFMTKDNEEQFYRTKIGPLPEVTASCLYVKHGVEIRIWSLSEDNTQSWVRISHGSKKYEIDSNNNDTESPEDLPEEQASQLNVKDFAARSKAKQNHTGENLLIIHRASFR